jgi:AraC-like DNA-binding protein
MLAGQTKSWGSFRFSTDGLPQAMRAMAVSELHERAPVPGGIEPLEPLSNCPVRLDIAKQALPGLGIMIGTACGIRQAARSRVAASGSADDLLIAVNLSGRSIVQQDDQELKLADGDAVLATRGPQGFSIIRPGPTHFLGLRVPRAAVTPPAGRFSDTPIQLLPRSNEALPLLVAYTSAILGEDLLPTPELRRLAVTHVHDLIAATVNSTLGRRPIADRPAIAAARLRAIMADIAGHLSDCELSVAAVAQRQHVTPRYIHKLFEREGLVFSQFVLSHRIARAHRMLIDPRWAQRSISSVAFETGFGDLSYFNRIFRRCYNATPTEVRRAAERDEFAPS